MAEIERNLERWAEEILRTASRSPSCARAPGCSSWRRSPDYLDRLPKVGAGRRAVWTERDLVILLPAVSPEAAVCLADKRGAIGDPEFRAIHLEYGAVFDWSSRDPGLYAPADRARRWFAHPQGRSEVGAWLIPNSTIAQLGTTSARHIVASLGPARRDRQATQTVG